MVSAACPSPNDPLGNGSVPLYFRGPFHSCMGTMPMLFTWQGLLVCTQQETTITLDNRDVLLAGVRHTMVASMAHLQIFKPCMWTMPYVLCPICIYSSLKITKWCKNTSLFRRRKEINVFWPVTEGLLWFYFLTNIGPAHHTYNIQLTKNNFNEIILFQNSPVQPLALSVKCCFVCLLQYIL
jgi:hypothetical protein